MIYFPPHKKVSTFLRHQLLHWRIFCLPTRSFTWTLSILASKVLLGYLFVSTAITVILLAAVGGRGDISHDDSVGGSRSRAWLLVWAGLLGIIAAFLAMIQYIPQIIETYLRKVTFTANTSKLAFFVRVKKKKKKKKATKKRTSFSLPPREKVNGRIEYTNDAYPDPRCDPDNSLISTTPRR
jgi:hypothetical protein